MGYIGYSEDYDEEDGAADADMWLDDGYAQLEMRSMVGGRNGTPPDEEEDDEENLSVKSEGKYSLI